MLSSTPESRLVWVCCPVSWAAATLPWRSNGQKLLRAVPVSLFAVSRRSGLQAFPPHLGTTVFSRFVVVWFEVIWSRLSGACLSASCSRGGKPSWAFNSGLAQHHAPADAAARPQDRAFFMARFCYNRGAIYLRRRG